MFNWLSGLFTSDSNVQDPISSSSSGSSTDDWTNAFGTGCDFQVPAEVFSDFPSHDFTTTFGSSLESDFSTASIVDSFSWD